MSATSAEVLAESYTKPESWALVHFVASDPGKEFEILHQTRLSISPDVILKPRLKVKVFYGKAKVEAYIVDVSEEYEYLRSNFKAITARYTDYMLRSIFNSANKLSKRKCSDSGAEDCNEEKTMEEEKNKGEEALKVLTEKYDSLKAKFNDLYKMYDEMRGTLDAVLEKTNALTEVDHQSENKENIRHMRPRRSKPIVDDVLIKEEDNVVYIGKNQTGIPRNIFETVNWNSCSSATRKLLVAVFSREVLATHSLTGKPSPAFLNAGKELKQQLDPMKTSDIIDVVAIKCNVTPSTVRSAITTKCADENKMGKKRKREI